jgi:hypothetical protein
MLASSVQVLLLIAKAETRLNQNFGLPINRATLFDSACSESLIGLQFEIKADPRHRQRLLSEPSSDAGAL